jgi:hypothetical protein
LTGSPPTATIAAMTSKPLLMIGMVVGSTVGSFLPVLWGAGWFSFASVICSAIGGFAGIWLAYRLGRQL